MWRAGACAQAECLRYVVRKFPFLLFKVSSSLPSVNWCALWLWLRRAVYFGEGSGFAGARWGAKRGRFAYLSKGDLLPDTGLGYWLRGTPRVDNASAPHSLAFLYLNEALIP